MGHAPVTTALARFEWQERLLSSNVFTDADVRILMRLALHQDR
jgi:hypothetical protein